MDKLLDPTHPFWKFSKITVVLIFLFAILKFNNVEIQGQELLIFITGLLGLEAYEGKLIKKREKKIIEDIKREI